MRRAVFWCSTALMAWVLAGYPAVAYLRGVLTPRPVASGHVQPTISIIIAARNEAQVIEAKLANLARLSYPPDRIQIVIASDGSTDRTSSIVSSVPDERVRLIDMPPRGKAAALNAARSVANGEILVFTDANSMLDADALHELTAPFADPMVGGVAGDQRYLKARSVGVERGERNYWDFERQLKRWESLAGNTVSGTGALYAIRAELYTDVPDGLTDDFYISTSVIARGRRLVYAPGAIAREPVVTSVAGEFRRKRRVAVRILRTQIAMRQLFNPRKTGFYALQLASHKTLRHLLPIPMATIAVASASLWSSGVLYRALTVAQVLAYGVGLLGLARHGTSFSRARVVAASGYVCLAMSAQTVALFDVLRGTHVSHWTPARTESAE